MRPVRYKKIGIFAVVFFVFCLSGPFISRACSIHVAWLSSPLWRIAYEFFWGVEPTSQEKLEQLEAENYLLRTELMRLHAEEGETIFPHGIKAHVIYRDPTTWNQTLWVDVGNETNKKKGEIIVAKNSCVLVGRAVVGIVDYVGTRQSRVRLLTDREIHPSVRSVRGELKSQAMIEHLDVIITSLSHQKEYASLFERIKGRLEEEKATLYLAKGIVQGAPAPLWRKTGTQLIGMGFNYDFADKQGAAKRINLTQPQALLQEGDLLVTTGMDGVFPPDLFVAFVTKIYPLKEGDVSYQLEAKPYVSNIDRFKSCTIIPPVEFDFDAL